VTWESKHASTGLGKLKSNWS